MATSGGSSRTIEAALGPDGSRLALKDGLSFGWTLFDLHDDLAALENQAMTAVTDALRYDGYGLTIDADGAFGSPWRYQGALDVAPDANPLYELGARLYAPSLGAFTSLDSFAGSAVDPLSLNRFLYAEANPATLIDPSGHYAQVGDAICPSCVPGSKPVSGQNPRTTTYKPIHPKVENGRIPAGDVDRYGYSQTASGGAAPASGTAPGPAGGGLDAVTATGGIALGGLDVVSEFIGGLAATGQQITACSTPLGIYLGLCSYANFVGSAIQDPEGTAKRTIQTAAYAGAEAAGQAQSDLTSGDPRRVSRSVFGVFLVVGLAGAGGVPAGAEADSALGVGAETDLASAVDAARSSVGLEPGVTPSAAVHANSASSPLTNYLYQLVDSSTGTYLKTGISSNPTARYSKAFLVDKEMQIVASGTRREMLDLERFVVERYPGPLNHEPWAGQFAGGY